MPYTLTFLPMLIILLCFYLDSSAGFCMPCLELNRRNTLWDLDRSFSSTRGLYIPKITSPTNATIWIIGSDVAVTWLVFFVSVSILAVVVADHSGTFFSSPWIIKESQRYA